VTIRVRAPATSANLGPAFDSAAVALELWNELQVEDGGEPDLEHLGVKAFSLLAAPAGRTFTFTSRIPRERGLGSSASVIALGLVAGARAAGLDPDPEHLLSLGLPLEGHGDNLAAALAGGVCLTWEARIARIADDIPAAPIALIPADRTLTADSRARLPETVSHADASFTAGRAALLGAALATRSEKLFASALHDRLHEQYRSAFLEDVRARLPESALGATLSGSGPTVMVWAWKDEAELCATALAGLHPEVEVLPLRVARQGAG
jgi:homoserine kinase